MGNYTTITTLVMCMAWEHNCLFNWNWNQHKLQQQTSKHVEETGLKHTCCAIGVSVASFNLKLVGMSKYSDGRAK